MLPYDPEWSLEEDVEHWENRLDQEVNEEEDDRYGDTNSLSDE